jgi:hypothetical protein
MKQGSQTEPARSFRRAAAPHGKAKRQAFHAIVPSEVIVVALDDFFRTEGRAGRRPDRFRIPARRAVLDQGGDASDAGQAVVSS